MKIFYFFRLTANPDYDSKIKDVFYWLVEYDEENIPTREIGLDENDNVILKMPYKKNYGFWTDNELLYDDFISRFSAIKVDNSYFNDRWNELIEN
jgi:hypothetical protein